MIALQFSREATPASAIIRWNTRSPWSHVDVIMPDGWLLGSRLNGGVKVRPPGYAKFTATAEYAIPLNTTQTANFMELAGTQLGKPYDWWAIVGLALNRNWRDPSRWFCSELVAWLSESVGYPILRVPNADRVTPRDLTVSYALDPFQP